jgi:hypothetical protein
MKDASTDLLLLLYTLGARDESCCQLKSLDGISDFSVKRVQFRWKQAFWITNHSQDIQYSPSDGKAVSDDSSITESQRALSAQRSTFNGGDEND